ncbi:MAG: sugar nucleotide-binding protein, partial [Bacteroidota bacterium]|nr:sugar nucleotide-binding protein [Bacteroidota bacterium]
MQDEQNGMSESKNIPRLWGGIECTINRVQDNFFDQLQYSEHYSREADIPLIADIGIEKIRYPILWEKHQPEKESLINWTNTEKRVSELKEKKIDIIAGLVHHGSGPAFTNLLDDNFPYLLADYARKVAENFPSISYFTPVNEPLTTARFSGLYGLWYPHKNDDASFLRMLINEMKGVVLSMAVIRKINPAAKLVQTEDLGKTYSTKSLGYQARLENHRRWLTYDLLCGRVDKKHPLWKYFISNDITQKELEFFQENICVPDYFGFNHYLTSERFLDRRIHRYPKSTHGGNGFHQYADVEAVRVELKEESGIEVLLKEAWSRYKKPIAITEVHLHCHREDQLRWFKQVWNSCNKLNAEGINIVAVTAWAMLGSYGWNKLLTEPGGEYEPGVFDVRSGRPRPTALAKYLKRLSAKEETEHSPLSNEAGWWQRNNRFFQKPLLIQNRNLNIPKNGAPILIIGKNGTLGKVFAKICRQRFLKHRLLSRQECNISDEAAVENAIQIHKPWAIINAAGFVRVDDAETEAGQCYMENTKGPETLSVAAAKHGIKFITFSSDLVFDGAKKIAYVEEDPTNPLNIYGRTKAEAEKIVLQNNTSSLIIRTSAFFGPWDEYNFVHYVRKSLSQYERVYVANDVIISPTYVPHLVNAALDL